MERLNGQSNWWRCPTREQATAHVSTLDLYHTNGSCQDNSTAVKGLSHKTHVGVRGQANDKTAHGLSIDWREGKLLSFIRSHR